MSHFLLYLQARDLFERDKTEINYNAMKHKSILLFFLLAATIASFNLVSCRTNEPDNDGYSEWAVLTEADSVIYAKARTAYLDDPANVVSGDYAIIMFLSHNPCYVRTREVPNGSGRNYQFLCTDDYVVTVFKAYGEDIGKVTEILVSGSDGYPAPVPPAPRKRDTIPY